MPSPFQTKLPTLPNLLASGAAFAPQRQFLNGTPVHSWYDDALADQAGYRGGNIPQGIPGTATNWTVDNPDPKLANRMAGVGSAPAAPTAAITPNRWFQNPFQTQATKELPYWMKGFNYGG